MRRRSIALALSVVLLALGANQLNAQDTKGMTIHFTGFSAGGGTFTRTITDVTEPPVGPGGVAVERALVSYPVSVTVGGGTTGPQLAALFAAAVPAQTAATYTAELIGHDNARVHIRRVGGGKFKKDGADVNTTGGIAEFTVNFLPAVSGPGLVALALSMLAAAAWMRRARAVA